MTAVMIGIDPHKGSHTAVAISAAEEPLGDLRVRASVAQAGQLVAWAASWPERTWAVEGAGRERRHRHIHTAWPADIARAAQPPLAACPRPRVQDRAAHLLAALRQTFGLGTPAHGPGAETQPCLNSANARPH
jgi:hypothetical protein